MTRKLYILILSVLAGVLLAATAVYANNGPFEKYPPEMSLYKGKVLLQKASYKGFSWTWWDKEAHRWWTDSYIQPPPAPDGHYRNPDRVWAQTVLSLRYMRPLPPSKVVIKSYDDKYLSGKPQIIEPDGWTPYKEGGKTIGWNIRFNLEKPHHEHFVKVYVKWDKRPGTHYSYGWKTQIVHLRTR